MKKIFSRLNVKIKSMTIGQKLRFVSGFILFVPMLLAVICMAIIYFSFSYNDASFISGYIVKYNNINLAYSACQFIDEAYQTQLKTTGDENPEHIYPEMSKKGIQGVVYFCVLKNGNLIYETKEINRPDNFDKLYKTVDSSDDMTFVIKNGNIIHRYLIENDSNIYELIAMGECREVSLMERNARFYVDATLVNMIMVLIAIIFIYLLSKFLHRSIFKRIEHSLNILSKGVEKISGGDLDYRIEYDRNDEFRPICDSFNNMAKRLKESIELTQRQDQDRKEILMFSPLTSIKAYVEGIINGVASTPEAQKKYLNVIKSKTEEIEKMLSELLFFWRLEYNETISQNCAIDLKSFIEEYISSVDGDYMIKNVQIMISRCDSAVVNGDPKLFKRMLNNIIDNSAKYSNKSVCHVEITLEAFEEKCVLSIADDGPGVCEESIDHIFEIFYRSDSARQKTGKGSGIGLSTVSNIVKKSMHGSVHAENVISGGLKIVIELPLA